MKNSISILVPVNFITFQNLCEKKITDIDLHTKNLQRVKYPFAIYWYLTKDKEDSKTFYFYPNNPDKDITYLDGKVVGISLATHMEKTDGDYYLHFTSTTMLDKPLELNNFAKGYDCNYECEDGEKCLGCQPLSKVGGRYMYVRRLK